MQTETTLFALFLFWHDQLFNLDNLTGMLAPLLYLGCFYEFCSLYSSVVYQRSE